MFYNIVIRYFRTCMNIGRGIMDKKISPEEYKKYIMESVEKIDDEILLNRIWELIKYILINKVG